MPPGTDSGETPPKEAAMSPQQILRARYKQQMMPPRTWKQQQARNEQIEAAKKSRTAQDRAAFTAAAAKATHPETISKPTLPPQSASNIALQSAELALENPLSPASSHSSSSSASSSSAATVQSKSSISQPFSGARPPMVRRGSSTTSISRAAALAAQSPRRYSDSASSRLSSLSSSSIRAPNNEESDITNRSPQKQKPGTHQGPRQTFISSDNKHVDNEHAGNKHAGTKHAGNKNVDNKTGRSFNQGKQTDAAAAAKASVLNPIEISPRVPLSSKFVSSLSQALRAQQEERISRQSEHSLLAPRDAANASVSAPESVPTVSVPSNTSGSVSGSVFRNASGNASSKSSDSAIGPFLPGSVSGARRSVESARRSVDSARSFGSGSQRSIESQGSHFTRQISPMGNEDGSSSLPKPHFVSGGHFAEYQQQQQQQQLRLQMERRKRNAEENKVNALQAAVAARGKAEEGMTNIHIQVNEAVQNALQKKRRNMMHKYRPAASWSAPAKIRPPLRKLQTSDSQRISEMRKIEQFFGKNLDQDTTGPNSPAISDSAGPSSLGSTGSTGISSAGISSARSNAFAPSSTPGDTSRPMYQMSMRSKPRPARPSRMETAPLPSTSNTSPSLLSPAFASASQSHSHIFNPSNNTSITSLDITGSPQSSPAAAESRMPKTLRGTGPRSGKRFNEEKPWKGHREITQLSERERKRYESLWAANRDIHLPYLYVPHPYEEAWMEALHQVLPNLMQKITGKPPSGSGTAGSGTASNSGAGSSSNNGTTIPQSANHPRPSHRRLESQLLSPVVSIRSARSNSSLPSVVSSIISECSSGEHNAQNSAQSSAQNLVPQKSEEGEVFSIDDELDEEDEDGYELPVEHIDMIQEVEKRVDELHGYVVARLWRRSRLPEEILAQIWDLVDTNKDGTLDRSGFTVGMWLCDQCLYGRKLPQKVSPEVWQSVGRLNLKIRLKNKRSKIGYMRRIPNMFGNALGHTMHGGRQAMKKAVQSATN